jgi:autotransporter-associated beta strand protein
VATVSGLLTLPASATVTATSNDAAGTFINKVTPDLNISAIIQSGVTSQITKLGNGTLALSSANLNTGGWKLQDGTLILNSATALGTTAGIFAIGDSTTANTVPLTILAGSAAIAVGANPITINRDFTFGGTASTNNLTLGGAVNLGAAARTITVSAPAVTATLSGVITSAAGSGANGLTKSGVGTLVLSGVSTNASLGGAGVTVSEGVLKSGVANALSDSTLITVNAGAVLDLAGFGQISQQVAGSGMITSSSGTPVLVLGGTSGTDVTTNVTGSFAGVIAGSAAVTKVGLGTQTLSGANQYTGATTAIAGTLVLSGSASSTSGIAISGGTGTVLQVTNAAATGSGLISINSGATTPTVNFTIDGGGTITLPNALGGNSGITTTFYVDNNGSGTNGVVLLNGSLANSSVGQVTYNVTGANGYSLSIANLRATASAAGNMTFNPTTAALVLGNLTGSQASGTNTWTLGGTNTGNSVTGVISNAGAGALSAVTKSGAGTWTLSGANTYTGATLVSACLLYTSPSPRD